MATGIRLIINADDFGAGSGTDHGIMQAFSEGLVTSASLLANGPHSATAARMAKTEGLPIGVHLNLAEGRPLTGPIPGLTLDNGELPGKQGLRRALTGSPNLAAVYRELNAQIETLLSWGLTPDHLDTHQHFFLFPAVTELILELAEYNNIPALRLPLPAEQPADDPENDLGQELQLYRDLAPDARRILDRTLFTTPRGLYGMPELNRIDEKALERIIQQIPAGDWELMVHPGCPDPENPFSGKPREAELQALLSRDIADLVQRRNIRLINFGDLI